MSARSYLLVTLVILTISSTTFGWFSSPYPAEASTEYTITTPTSDEAWLVITDLANMTIMENSGQHILEWTVTWSDYFTPSQWEKFDNGSMMEDGGFDMGNGTTVKWDISNFAIGTHNVEFQVSGNWDNDTYHQQSDSLTVIVEPYKLSLFINTSQSHITYLVQTTQNVRFTVSYNSSFVPAPTNSWELYLDQQTSSSGILENNTDVLFNLNQFGPYESHNLTLLCLGTMNGVDWSANRTVLVDTFPKNSLDFVVEAGPDLSVGEDSGSHNISWLVYWGDLMSWSYWTIRQNSSWLQTGGYQLENNTEVTYDVGSFDVGVWNVTLEGWGQFSNGTYLKKVGSILVTVHPAEMYTIWVSDQPRLTYEVGTSPHHASWTVAWGQFVTFVSWSMYLDGILNQTGSSLTNGSSLSWDVSGLARGAYELSFWATGELTNGSLVQAHDNATLLVQSRLAEVGFILTHTESPHITYKGKTDPLFWFPLYNNSYWPSYYTVHKNGTQIRNSGFTNNTIVELPTDVEVFAGMTYNYTIVFNGFMNDINWVNTSTVLVEVKDPSEDPTAFMHTVSDQPNVQFVFESETVYLNWTLQWGWGLTFNTWILYRDDVQVNSGYGVTNGSFVTTDVSYLSIGVYNYTLIAQWITSDSVTYRASDSAVVTVTDSLDFTPPTINCSVANGTILANETVHMRFEASDDGWGVANLTVYINGAWLNVWANAGEFYKSLTVEGWYNFTALAYDNAGNKATLTIWYQYYVPGEGEVWLNVTQPVDIYGSVKDMTLTVEWVPSYGGLTPMGWKVLYGGEEVTSGTYDNGSTISITVMEILPEKAGQHELTVVLEGVDFYGNQITVSDTVTINLCVNCELEDSSAVSGLTCLVIMLSLFTITIPKVKRTKSERK